MWSLPDREISISQDGITGLRRASGFMMSGCSVNERKKKEYAICILPDKCAFLE